MKSAWLAASVLAVALTFAAQAPARAHAELVRSDPPESAVLDVAPDRVRLEFEEPVEAKFNPIEVYDEEEDNRVDLDDAGVDPNDPNALTASLGRLSPGRIYRVEYRVTSQDGDPVEEAYSFVLSEGAKVNTAAPEEAADSPVEEPEDEGVGFGRLALYGGLLLAGLLALRLTVFGRKG